MKRILMALISTAVATACTAQPFLPQGPAPQPALSSQREPLSAIMGDAPNFAASSNGNLLAAISRDEGRGSKPGALVELYYPNLNQDHLWDAYSGVSYRGQFYWLHQFKLLNQTVLKDSDIVVTEFESPDGHLRVTTQDLVLRRQQVLVRQVQFTNQSNEPISDLTPFFYENLSVDLLPQGDICEFDSATGVIHHYQKDTHFSVAFDAPPAQFQCGGIKNFLTKAHDAMHDAEDGQLNGNPKANAYIGLGVNGTLAMAPQVLGPGQTFSQRSFIAAGQNYQASLAELQAARNLSWQEMVIENKSYWQDFLGRSRMPQQASPQERDVYRRALIVMKQNTSPTGAILAAPTTTSPPYKFSWPRDGSFIALAYLQTGHSEEARRFFDFMAKAQKSNGGWAINYMTNGRAFYDFGDRHNEHDQVGTLAWGMFEYFKQTGDRSWLEGKWPVIQKAADFLLRKIDARTGLLGPTCDLWELSASDSWTYTNAAGYGGLKASAEVARIMGQPELAARYEQAADAMKQGIFTHLWIPKGGYYARGVNLNSQKQDPKVEAANLALVYPFQVFPAHDPRMIQMAEKIQLDLGSAQGGVRRYTGDEYYDGQPWPVTTEWLGIYYSRLGQPQKARALHQTTTGYAMSTGSLQLGEQFDERRKAWVSALPLTWSGAKYILNALAMEASSSSAIQTQRF